jgi:monoamine oxidase
MMMLTRLLASLFLGITLISVPAHGDEKAAKTVEHAQVIVVGAGMAGMTAALSLAQKGIDVVVLEKEDAVGGRVYSPLLDGVAANLGAQYYFPGIHPLVDKYLESLPSQAIEPGGFFWRGNFEKAAGDSYTPKAIADPVNRAFQQMRRDFQRASKGKEFFFDREPRNTEWDRLEKISSYTYLSKFPPEVFEFFNGEIGVETGGNLRNLSAIVLVGWNGHGAETRFILKGGNGLLLEKMNDDLRKAGGRTFVNSEVSRVSQTRSSVTAECADGRRYTADYLIMATPAFVTKAIVSALPKEKARALTAVSYLPMNELGLQVQNFPKQSMLVWGEPINGIVNQTGTIAGEPDKGTVVSITITDPEMLKLGDNQLIERAASVLKKISPEFDPGRDILAYAVKRWKNGIFELPPSFLSEYQKDLKAPAGRVFFAGDYLADPSLMGAAWSGSRAADEIIKTMGAKLNSR